LDPLREPSRFVRLDEKMHVVALNGEVQNPKRIARGGRQRSGDRGEHPIGTERGQIPGCPQRHVDRTPCDVRAPRAVRNATPAGRGLPSGIGAGAAPGALPERQKKLSLVCAHLNRQ
jgi:hypothetical protein